AIGLADRSRGTGVIAPGNERRVLVQRSCVREGRGQLEDLSGYNAIRSRNRADNRNGVGNDGVARTGDHGWARVVIDRDPDGLRSFFDIGVVAANREHAVVEGNDAGTGLVVSPVNAGSVVGKRLGPAWVREGGHRLQTRVNALGRRYVVAARRHG